MIKSPEFYVNMKDIPTKDSRDYLSFYANETEKIKYGLKVNGVYIHGWLYWHINMWKIHRDILDVKDGSIVRQFLNPQLRDTEWLIAEKLKQAEDEKKGLNIIGSRRLGKALQNDEILYGENKTFPIKDAKIGDKIYDHTGNLTNIIGVFPQGKVQMFELTLLDGRKVKCCKDHLWKVRNSKNSFEVLDTTTLFNSYYKDRIHNGYKDTITRITKDFKYKIQINNCVQYSKQDILIDPYFLGLWLGDGSSRVPKITTIDNEIIDYLKGFAELNNLKITDYIKKDTTVHDISLVKKEGKVNPLTEKLKKYNLLLNKHIPREYLYNSEEVREELLRGLMDTDGYVSKEGTIQFSTSSKQLAKDVEFLSRSLGISTRVVEKQSKLNGVDKKISYIFSFFTNRTIVKLTRKKERLNILNKGMQPKIHFSTIINIEKIEDDYATCIMVDNEEKLFLTSNFLVTHNSVFMSSYIGRSATIYQGSENVIVGNNKDDISVITSLTEKGLSAVPDYYKFGRINDDWSKEVTLGFKDRKGNRDEWSKIFIRNTNNGNLTEVVAGTTPKSLIFDEVGKAPISDALSAAIPAFTSPYGWRAVPILVGTGGDFENGKDAQRIFDDPDNYNMVSMFLPEEGNKKTGIFIPGTWSLEFEKEEKSLAEFTGTKKGSELDDIKILVSTLDKNKELILNKRKELEKAKDGKELLKYKMYYPLTSDECFLTETGNDFPIEAAMKQLDLIMRKEELQGTPIKLERDVITNKLVQHELPKNKVIWEYPHDIKGELDAPIVIYEKPIDNPPLYLYIAGIDPYNTSQSVNSNSLGTCFVYKRLYNLIDGTYQQRIVASYASRPNTIKEWNENVEKLLEYYNAIAMMENEGTTLLNHLDNKNKAHYLADGFSLLKEISPNTSILGRNKGLPATPPVIRHGNNLLIEYCKEEVLLGYDEENKPIMSLGIARITDPVLLKEMIAYKKGANVDRIVAFRHALIYDKYLEKIFPIISVQKEKKPMDIQKEIRSPFSIGNGNAFGVKRKSPFS